MTTLLSRAWLAARQGIHWNFFRIHLANFTLIPLIFSGIVYAGNIGASGNASGSTQTGIQKVDYVDCLFLCYSAMTTTGLVTVNLSALHPFQQACLIFLAVVGDSSFVALLMVLARKRFFRVHCQNLLQNDQRRRTETYSAEKKGPEPRVIEAGHVGAPVRVELLHNPIPDRTLVESPTLTQRNQLSDSPVNDTGSPRRHHIRSRTLGQRTITMSQRQYTKYPLPTPTRDFQSGLGGFSVLTQLGNIIHTTFRLPVKDDRSLTLLTREKSHDSDEWSNSIKRAVVSWLPEGVGGLVVGRNSRFFSEELEDEELEQVGGVEYRALRFLSYFVAGYIFLCQVIPFAIMAIYFSSTSYWSSAFQASAGVQTSTIHPVFSSLYFAISGYTGAGMSLVDQSLVPFAGCYLVIWVLNFAMLLGNHAFPMTLRLLIWIGTKITGKSTLNQTLHFLLDHPRRCFLYLFPSHQTWYLVLALAAFILIEMFSFLVLNIGLPVVDGIDSGWQKFSDGILQSLSVRASGFGIVALPLLAPSTLFLYVILMYIAIYPIALSVRSTNVYEEQALGVYNPEDETSEAAEPTPDQQKPTDKKEIFSKYLMWHVRRQLAFDIWPLALAVFLIACFERSKIMNPDTGTWFTLFRIIFECTSAYSMIGLSLGTPNNNYSFSGEFTVMSKIVLMIIMIRGRHRGLPVAIDRAVMLPKAFSR